MIAGLPKRRDFWSLLVWQRRRAGFVFLKSLFGRPRKGPAGQPGCTSPAVLP